MEGGGLIVVYDRCRCVWRPLSTRIRYLTSISLHSQSIDNIKVSGEGVETNKLCWKRNTVKCFLVYKFWIFKYFKGKMHFDNKICEIRHRRWLKMCVWSLEYWTSLYLCVLKRLQTFARVMCSRRRLKFAHKMVSNPLSVVVLVYGNWYFDYIWQHIT